MKEDTSFNRFAEEYDKQMGDTGDYAHQNTIDKCLLDLVGSVSGLTIYDLACGNGYMPRKFVKGGAKEIWASDVSEKLIDYAKNKYDESGIRYLLREADNFKDIPENYFDLITMHMAIFYIEDLDKLFGNIYKSLKPNGRFVFTCDHPLRQVAYKTMGIDIDLIAEYEDYLNEGLRQNFNHWTKKQDDLTIYRRPLGSLINALSRNNLFVKGMTEPKTIASYQGKHVETNIPFKMGLEAIKKL
jgi:ubiquinone/menaquinone biosynthesis C-methylase UbiE